MQKLNLPNKLTLIRMFLAPIYLALMLIEFPYHYIVALAVFAVASLTDMLDGKIARKNNLITVSASFSIRSPIKCSPLPLCSHSCARAGAASGSS